MIIKIEGNKTFVFPDNIEPEERLILVNNMLNETITINCEELTVDEHFRDTFNVRGTITNLEKISYYLSKMPEQNGKEDKEILSRNDILEMDKGVRKTTKNGKNIVVNSKYRNFSETTMNDAVKIGIVDSDERY